MLDHIDTCVVGGGVIGLSIARVLSALSPELFVLEKVNNFGQGISSRNSEVIHAGIYYQKDSLKSSLCRKGKVLLYDYCQRREISHRVCGKLIVATSAEDALKLEGIRANAMLNDVEDLQFWSAAQLRQAEPEVQAQLALHSPSSGIVNSHELMTALVADIAAENGQIINYTLVKSITRKDELFLLECEIDGSAYQFTSRVLVNAAGLGALALARQCDFLEASQLPTLYLCKGSYYNYMSRTHPRSPFQRLIYPVPDKSGAGLGIHATIDMAGQLKFGPDVEYIDAEDYSLSSDSTQRYYEAIKRYFPALEISDLQPAYVGIRPKLQGPGDPEKDFVIESYREHGVPGLVQLFGIESPGLTSCLAIGNYVGELLEEFY